MAIRPILRMGDSRLLTRAEPVIRFGCRELDELIDDMVETMRAAEGVGLAAPQIGVSLQVVVFEVKNNPRYPEAGAVPLTVLINPELTESGETEDGWEGCLSIPGMRGLVPRRRQLHYCGFDQAGRAFEREVDGFHARVVQHECDHLQGLLYPMRISDLRNFGFSEALFPDSPASGD